MPIEQTNTRITMTQRDVAVAVAKAVASSGLPVPSKRIRNDVDWVQIDPIIIEYKVTKRRPGVQLKFDVAEEYGFTLNVDLKLFEEDPQGYLHDLFQHIHPMLRNSKKLRRNRKLIGEAMYEILTEEAQGNA